MSDNIIDNNNVSENTPAQGEQAAPAVDIEELRARRRAKKARNRANRKLRQQTATEEDDSDNESNNSAEVDVDELTASIARERNETNMAASGINPAEVSREEERQELKRILKKRVEELSSRRIPRRQLRHLQAVENVRVAAAQGMLNLDGDVDISRIIAAREQELKASEHIAIQRGRKGRQINPNTDKPTHVLESDIYGRIQKMSDEEWEVFKVNNKLMKDGEEVNMDALRANLQALNIAPPANEQAIADEMGQIQAALAQEAEQRAEAILAGSV